MNGADGSDAVGPRFRRLFTVTDRDTGPRAPARPERRRGSGS